MEARLSLSKILCLKERSSFLQGEYEGAGAPSYGIECLQKPALAGVCAAQRQIFGPHSGPKIETLVRLSNNPVAQLGGNRVFSTYSGK